MRALTMGESSNATSGQLPQGGPYIVKDGNYVPYNSTGIEVNNFESVNYNTTPVDTQNQFDTNPVPALSLVTDPLPDGSYLVTVGFIPSTTSRNASFVANVWIDGVKVSTQDYRMEPKDVNNTPWVGISTPITISDGLVQPHTFEFKFGRDGFGGQRAQLYHASIRLESEGT